MILSSNKSNLMKIIEAQQHMDQINSSSLSLSGTNERSLEEVTPPASYSTAVLEGMMAELQALHKPAHVKSCHDLATEFCRKIDSYLLRYN